MEQLIFDNGITLRNILDAANITETNPNMLDVFLLNIKHIKRRKETEKYLFLNDILDKTQVQAGFPKLDETLRSDVLKFFNTQITNNVNRVLKTTYAKIKIINDNPVESIITIDNYMEDMPDLIEMSKNNVNLEKALRKIDIVTDIGKLDKETEEDLKTFCMTNEDVLPIIYATKITVIKVRKINIPTNSVFEKGLPVLIDDFNKFFPESGLSPMVIENETLILSDDQAYLVNRNFNESIAIRKFNTNEIFSLVVIK